MAKRDYKAELEALLEWTEADPSRGNYVNREAVMLSLIRYLQGQVDEKTAAFVNMVLGIAG
jgi:hypothetical protein